MKNIIITAILSIILVSCTDAELDQSPISSLGANGFYSNPNEFESAINGAYSTLRFYPDNQFHLLEVRSDNMYAVTGSGVRPYEPVNNFDNSIATNTYLSGEWNTNYTGILRVNTILENLNEQVVPDNTTRNRMEGEAKFLRAFFFFNLVKTFGKVPLIDKVYSPAETLDIGRSSVSDVYTLIISDIQSAITLLPPNFSGGQLGKATSWAAKALLAKVYLTRSGSSYGIEGPGMDSNEYGLAIDLFDDIINNGPFDYENDYAAIFAYDNENNSEIIFDIQYIKDPVVGADYPSITVPDGYLRANDAGFTNGEDSKRVSEDLINAYTSEDIRDDFSIINGYTDENGLFVNNIFYGKYLDLSNKGTSRFEWSLNYPVIRYTDIQMMRAEAILMSGAGRQSDVDAVVNFTRNRAGLTTSISDVNIDDLLKEKRLEFACESKRWDDLVRTGKVIDVINSWIAVEDDSNQMSQMEANFVIYPVPSNEITVKEDLYGQNPGYK
ncbi:RagB/SusD family nutrient uptake outer membrane protein [Thalassobellus suaedae]|uniref:RagB/SusD family nutrient uptake outer membrane protein n=1 Tax=Thalassobellus suaedae TaxID=3074124 RepID=A0ABY9XXM2_9FLAO|nr:RagB/SusD family nutrient uptake outer membrane protein [Flavobacteriaceae bacterium HL-DH14]